MSGISEPGETEIWNKCRYTSIVKNRQWKQKLTRVTTSELRGLKTTLTFDMTILESRCVGWVVSYHRCSCETHLDQLGFQLLLQVVGLRRSGATGPQLDSQRSQLPAGLHSRWTFITNVDTKLIVRTFWTTYLSNAQVCWQYGICACSHQTTWWTESFEYINLKTEQ